jgi:hypothetical protein
VSDTEQNWYFHPREDWPPFPVSEGEMVQGIERYRRRSAMATAAVWITFFAAFLWFCWTGYSGGGQAIGLVHVITFPLALVIGFVAHAWAMYTSLHPFKRGLHEYVAAQARAGEPVDQERSESENEPWISISANRGGCIVIAAIGALASYGLFHLVS